MRFQLRFRDPAGVTQNAPADETSSAGVPLGALCITIRLER
jgi:hypothetical protein